MSTMKTVTDGNGTTHFFDVQDSIRIVSNGPPVVALPPAKSGAIGATMLFIPQAVSLVEQATMLVYYHGHHGPASIEGYVTSKTERNFRPHLKYKKVLFVEPQGGPKSRFVDLGTPAGLASLIDDAMFKAFVYGRPPRQAPVPTPKPPALILAAFSGGGAALNAVVLDSKADYLNRLTEVWCFDSMYSGEGMRWLAWAKAAKKTLRVRVSTEEAQGAPGRQAEAIRNAMNGTSRDIVDIDKPVASTHEALPGKFIGRWLQN